MATYSSALFTLLVRAVDSDDVGDLEATNCEVCGISVNELLAESAPIVRPAQCSCDRVYCYKCLQELWQIDRATAARDSNATSNHSFECATCGKVGKPDSNVFDLSNEALSDEKVAFMVEYFEVPETHVRMGWEKFKITEISDTSQDEASSIIWRFIYSQRGYEISLDDLCGSLTMELENENFTSSETSMLEQRIATSAIQSMRNYRRGTKGDKKIFASELSSSIRYANARISGHAQGANTAPTLQNDGLTDMQNDANTNNQDDKIIIGQNVAGIYDQNSITNKDQSDAVLESHDNDSNDGGKEMISASHPVTNDEHTAAAGATTTFSAPENAATATPPRREIMTRKKSALTPAAQVITPQSNKTTYTYRGARYEVDANTKPEWLNDQKRGKMPE